MMAAGPRAWDANAQASLPRFYFDWAKARASLERGQHPVTPPVSLFYALDLALGMMLSEGWKRSLYGIIVWATMCAGTCER